MEKVFRVLLLVFAFSCTKNKLEKIESGNYKIDSKSSISITTNGTNILSDNLSKLLLENTTIRIEFKERNKGIATIEGNGYDIIKSVSKTNLSTNYDFKIKENSMLLIKNKSDTLFNKIGFVCKKDGVVVIKKNNLIIKLIELD